MLKEFDRELTISEKKRMDSLDSPYKIQLFLNAIPYSEDDFYRSPLRLLRDKKGHCFDGALFAAMALSRIGFPPVIMELIPNGRDDDHIIALYKKNGCWGAVAQSNFTGIRFREPVYRSLRELAMSFFEQLFNSNGEKTMIGYRNPINLHQFDHLHWMTRDDGLNALSQSMDRYKIHPVITPRMAAILSPVDERSKKAGLMGANPAGLFKPPKE